MYYDGSDWKVCHGIEPSAAILPHRDTAASTNFRYDTFLFCCIAKKAPEKAEQCYVVCRLSRRSSCHGVARSRAMRRVGCCCLFTLSSLMRHEISQLRDCVPLTTEGDRPEPKHGLCRPTLF